MLQQFIRDKWKTSLWLVVAGLIMTVMESWGKDRTLRVYFLVGSFTVFTWLFLWLGNAFLSAWLDVKISWQERPLRRLFCGLASMLAYTLSVIYFLIYFYRWILHFDVGDDMGGLLLSTVIITILISMFMTGRLFLINWRQVAVDAEKLKKENVKAQYESLKNQVNPHFLFNSLNALTHLVYEDQDKAARFIKQLSEVYRYVLDTREKEVVTVEEEIRFVKSYLYLQQIRFESNLSVKLNLESTKGKVAPLALQLLLENAIKHNIISKDEPLTIAVFEQNGYIVVENTLQKKNITPENASGIGLKNICNRYKFLSNKEVMISNANGKFTVKLPILESDEV